jgi:1-acyl-sn-glycerol-3-phosphate acyltransferase
MLEPLDANEAFQVGKVETLIDGLRNQAELNPDRRAFTYLDDQDENLEARITYGELDRRAQQIAAELLRLGAGGKVVMHMFAPGLDFVTGFFGCLYAGVLTVPMYPPFNEGTLGRFKAVLKTARPHAIVTNSLLRGAFEGVLGPLATDAAWITVDQKSDLDELRWKRPAVNPDSIAFIQYTSGSTSHPKGAMLTHGNLIANIEMIVTGASFTPETIGFSWLPPYHDMGLIGTILATSLHGLPTVMMSPLAFMQKPMRWLRAISKYRCTHSATPNFAFDLCVAKATDEDVAALDLSCWEMAFCAAEPVRAKTVDRFCERFAPAGFRRETLRPAYGLAEATLIVTSNFKAKPVIRSFDRDAFQQGRVAPAVENGPVQILVGAGRNVSDEQEIAIVDPDTGRRVEPGVIGEIWVRGPHVSKGYMELSVETKQTFGARISGSNEGPFLRTGDLGFFDGDQLFIAGRLKDLIIIRGRNHYPQDLEEAVDRAHPAVRRGCSAAFPIEVAGQEVAAVVVEVDRRLVFEPEEVIDAVRAAINSAFDITPGAITLIAPKTLKKTTSGKVMRRAMRADFLAAGLDVVASWSAPVRDHSMRFRLVNGVPVAEPERIPMAQPTRSIVSAPAMAQPTLAVAPVAPAPTAAHAPPARAEQPPIGYGQSLLWLATRLAQLLGVKPTEIDPRKTCAELGVDSLAAVELVEAVESVGITMDVGLFREDRSIENLADILADRAQAARQVAEASATAIQLDPPVAPAGVRSVPPPRHPKALRPFALWAKTFYDLTAHGLSNVPEGVSIFCPNHESHLDVFFVASVLPEEIAAKLVCFAKREHFESQPWRAFAELARAIPLDREGDVRGSMRLAGEALRSGRPLLIHPEGTRTTNGQMNRFRGGAAVLAMQHQVPLVPVRIVGAFGIYPPSRKLPRLFDWQHRRRLPIEVRFGKPIMPPDIIPSMREIRTRVAVAELMRTLQAAVAAL